MTQTVLVIAHCISFSRKVLWLQVSVTNNDSSVVAGYYLDAVKQYGKNLLCAMKLLLLYLKVVQGFLGLTGEQKIVKFPSFSHF